MRSAACVKWRAGRALLAPGGLALCLACGTNVPNAAAPTTHPTATVANNTVAPAFAAPGAPAEGHQQAFARLVDFSGKPSALRRLSRDELVATLQSLTGLAPERGDLPEEQRAGHHPLRTSGVSLIGSEVGKLFQVIKTFAVQAAPGMLTQSGCALTGQAQRTCLLGWYQGFSERALRRAQRPNERNKSEATLAIADGSPGRDRVAMEGLLIATFFAPSFLYRTEIGVASDDDPTEKVLTPTELAVKLSYFATLAPPDEALLLAAQSGKLAHGSERVRQWERLSETAAGKRAKSVLVEEWLGAAESKVSRKSPMYLRKLRGDFAHNMRTDADNFIDGVLSGPDPSVGHLLTGKEYVESPLLKQLIAPSTASGVPTGDVPEFERLGLLMHPQILSSHTKEDGASPFQLGYFIREALLCEKVRPPPGGASALARKDVPSGSSMRESLEYRTSAGPTCTKCHSLFAPLGYAFMAFDPVGRWVTADPSGKPWDLAGHIIPGDGSRLEFQTPAELVRELAASPIVQACFAQTALEWSLGRGVSRGDASFVARLDASVKTHEASVPEIMKTIVGAPEFMKPSIPNEPVQELP